MITVNLDQPSFSKQAARHLPQLRARTLSILAHNANLEVRTAIPTRFKLRRPWIISGIRYKKAQPTNPVAEVFSRDFFMHKQEAGAKFERQAHRLTVPVRRLQDRAISKAEKPSKLLSRPRFYKDKEGIYERQGGSKRRKWYHFTEATNYRPRFAFHSTVQGVVDEQAQPVFDAQFARFY